MASKHRPDLILCRNQPGISPGYLCHRCDGHCPLCDSQNPNTLRNGSPCYLCDECAYQTTLNSSIGEARKCMICGVVVHQGREAFYCRNCVLMGKDRDGCARVINLGEQRKDYVFQNEQRR